MSGKDVSHVLGIAAFVGIALGAAAGWILNVVALIHATEFSGMVIARAAGIFFFPLGCVLGWI